MNFQRNRFVGPENLLVCGPREHTPCKGSAYTLNRLDLRVGRTIVSPIGSIRSRMNTTPRWFWPTALLPLANAIGFVALYRYERAHPVLAARWFTNDNIGMAVALYIGFVLLLYLLIQVRRRPATDRTVNSELEAEGQCR